jgi:hypothetical protein
VKTGDERKPEEEPIHSYPSFPFDDTSATERDSLVESASVTFGNLSLDFKLAPDHDHDQTPTSFVNTKSQHKICLENVQNCFKALDRQDAETNESIAFDRSTGDHDETIGDSDRQLSALYKFNAAPTTNLKFVCTSANNELTYTITVNKTNDPVEIDFARAEALYAHGLTHQAAKLSIRLAEHLLRNPPKMNFDLDQLTTIKSKKSKSKLNATLRQPSLMISTLYSKITFLCNVLSENAICYDLAFQVGLLGLELARPPARIKSLEVKLINQEQDLFGLLKRIPLEGKQMALLRQKAIDLRDGCLPARGAVLPLMLSSYIFDALVLSAVEPQRCAMKVQDRLSTDEPLAFSAAVVAVGMKCVIPEVDYPLLFEGIRRQRADLAITLLVHYKNDERKLVKIMQKLLDRSFYCKTNQCIMNCVGPCICQSLYSCPKCSKSNVIAPTASSSGSTDVHASTGSDCYSTSGPGSARVKEMSAFVHAAAAQAGAIASTDGHAIARCESPPSSNVMYPTVDPKSIDPYKQWNHAQPIEKRTRAFGCEPSHGHNDPLEAAAGGPVPFAMDSAPNTRRLSVSGNASFANEQFGWLNDADPDVVYHDRSADFHGSYANEARQLELECGLFGDDRDGEPMTQLHQLASCLSCPCMVRESRELEHLSLSSIGAFATINANGHSSHGSSGSGHSRNNNASSGNNGGNKNRCKDRNKASENSHQTVRATAHFMFELAKTVLAKAGGNNCTVDLFRQPSAAGDEHVQTNKQLHICAFQLGLYSLGLFNSTSTNWCMRTYSSHVSWISTQAMEIGSPAIAFLIATWRGHLTPSEVAALADRASRGYSPQMMHTAARLALSCLLHASSLNPNEIQRAIIQCKEQNDVMLTRALEFIECAARQGGIGFEIMFEVARRWADLAETVKIKAIKRKEDENKKRKKRNAELAAMNQHPMHMSHPHPPPHPPHPSSLPMPMQMHSNQFALPAPSSPSASPASNLPVSQSNAASNSAFINAALVAPPTPSAAPSHPASSSPMMIGMYVNRPTYPSNVQSSSIPNPMPSIGRCNSIAQMQSPLLPTPSGSNAPTMAPIYGSSNVRPPSTNAGQPMQVAFWPWGNNPPASVMPNAIGVAPSPVGASPNVATNHNYPIMGAFPTTGNWSASIASPGMTSASGPAPSPLLPASVPPGNANNLSTGSSFAMPPLNMQGAYFNPASGQMMIPNAYSSAAHHPSHVPQSTIGFSPASASHVNHHPHAHNLPSNGAALDTRAQIGALHSGAASNHYAPRVQHSIGPINAMSHASSSSSSSSSAAVTPYNHPPTAVGQDQRLAKPMDAHQAHLIKAYQIGLLAMDGLCKRVQDEKPRSRFARFTPYGEDVKWLFSISKKLGFDFVHEFCRYACSCIQSPFVLHEIIDLACDVLRTQFQLPDMQVYASPMLKPLILKCQHM